MYILRDESDANTRVSVCSVCRTRVVTGERISDKSVATQYDLDVSPALDARVFVRGRISLERFDLLPRVRRRLLSLRSVDNENSDRTYYSQNCRRNTSYP